MVAQRLRDYEMMMILTPEATEEEVTSSVDRISKFIEDQGGSVTSQETIGQRRLAYSINKFMEGTSESQPASSNRHNRKY